MANKQLFFFATGADLAEMLSIVEAQANVTYHKSGLLSKEEMASHPALPKESLGIAESGDNNQCISYLVLYPDTELQVRVVPQRAGGEKMAIDQQRNPASLFFRPAGKYAQGQAIIEGKIGTISTDKQSIDLFNLFAKALRSKFKKANNYLVGKEAMEHYTNGWRLVQNVSSPKDYDFQVTNS